MEREQLELYAVLKTTKFIELAESDEIIESLRATANDCIGKINNRLKEIADSVYPGIPNFRYITGRIGNVGYIEELIPYDFPREFQSAIQNDITEKLIDEALAKTKILDS